MGVSQTQGLYQNGTVQHKKRTRTELEWNSNPKSHRLCGQDIHHATVIGARARVRVCGIRDVTSFEAVSVCIKFIFRVLDMTHDKIGTDYKCQTVEGPDSELEVEIFIRWQ